MGQVSEQVVTPMLEEFTRSLNGLNRPGGLLRVTGSYDRSPTSPQPVESDAPMPVFAAPCCNRPVKHDGSSEVLFCVTCGSKCRP